MIRWLQEPQQYRSHQLTLIMVKCIFTRCRAGSISSLHCLRGGCDDSKAPQTSDALVYPETTVDICTPRPTTAQDLVSSPCPMSPGRVIKGTWAPFNWQWSTLIRIWISNHRPSKVCYDITYTFPNFNGSSAEVQNGWAISSHTL